jgi:hypothetical protein
LLKFQGILFGSGYQGEGEGKRKGEGEQMWWKYFVFMYENRTMKPVGSVLRLRGRGIKEKDRGGKSNLGIL